MYTHPQHKFHVSHIHCLYDVVILWYFLITRTKQSLLLQQQQQQQQKQQRDWTIWKNKLQTKKKVRRSPVKFHYFSFLLLLLEPQTYNLPEMILNFRISFLLLVGAISMAPVFALYTFSIYPKCSLWWIFLLFSVWGEVRVSEVSNKT